MNVVEKPFGVVLLIGVSSTKGQDSAFYCHFPVPSKVA